MRIDSSSRVGIGTTAPGSYNTNGDDLVVANTSANAGITVATGSSFASRIYFADGTTGSETLAGFLDYGHSTDHLAFGVNASERARIDSSGRLLVGTSNARSNILSSIAPGLQVEGINSSSSSLCLTRSDASTSSNPPFIFLTSTGGTTVGSNALVVNNTSATYFGSIQFCGTDGTKPVSAAEIASILDGTPGANDMPGRLVFSTTADGASSPTERMRINQSGTVTFSNYGSIPITFVTGTQSTNVTHDRIQFNANTGAYYVINQNAVGVRLDNGTQSWAAQSDERLKTGLNSFNDALAKVSTFRAGTGRFLTDDESVSRSFLIAQDVQKVLPEAVSVDNDETGTLYLRYTELIPLLVAALKEAKERIEALEAEVAALKSK
jgi:hypothetical protein